MDSNWSSVQLQLGSQGIAAVCVTIGVMCFSPFISAFPCSIADSSKTPPVMDALELQIA